jgi:hypothetical protein
MSEQTCAEQKTSAQPKTAVTSDKTAPFNWLLQPGAHSGGSAGGGAASMPRKDVELFVKYAWFFGFFFALLLLIASFGIIAES